MRGKAAGSSSGSMRMETVFLVEAVRGLHLGARPQSQHAQAAPTSMREQRGEQGVGDAVCAPAAVVPHEHLAQRGGRIAVIQQADGADDRAVFARDPEAAAASTVEVRHVGEIRLIRPR